MYAIPFVAASVDVEPPAYVLHIHIFFGLTPRILMYCIALGKFTQFFFMSSSQLQLVRLCVLGFC